MKRLFFHIYEVKVAVNAKKHRETLANIISYANRLYPQVRILEQDKATPPPIRQFRQNSFDSLWSTVSAVPAKFASLWAIANLWQILKHEIEEKQSSYLDELRRQNL